MRESASALLVFMLATACTGQAGPGESAGNSFAASRNTGGSGSAPALTSDVTASSTGGAESSSGLDGPASGSDTTNSTTSGSVAGVTTSDSTTGGTAPACTIDTVRQIFAGNCSASVCHDSVQAAAGLDLSGADPAGQMLGVPSSLCAGSIRLVAGSPEQSLLWQKLSQSQPACGDPMPLGSTLNATDLGCVRQWIVDLGDGIPDCETCGGSACVDVTRDAANCGACGASCSGGQVCTEGVCIGCPEGTSACGASCVDLSSDRDHCGACDVYCGSGESCNEGKCQCDTTGSVSFSGDVAPMLAASCAGRGCHGGAMPREGLDLNSEASYDHLVGVTASECSDGRLLVAPGDPARSYLLQKLTGADLCSGTLMPKADSPLSSSEIALLSGWICAGANP